MLLNTVVNYTNELSRKGDLSCWSRYEWTFQNVVSIMLCDMNNQTFILCLGFVPQKPKVLLIIIYIAEQTGFLGHGSASVWSVSERVVIFILWNKLVYKVTDWNDSILNNMD